MSASGRRRTCLLALLVVIAAGCATQVGVRRVSEPKADRRLAANVLATGAPSAWSRHTLHRLALLDLYGQDREGALAKLHASLAEPDLEPQRLKARLFALSELSFHHARKTSGGILGRWRREQARAWFLASTVYAFGYVARELRGSTQSAALDSRTRLAADLYNRGLAEGLERDGTLRVADGEHVLPFGTLSLDLDEATLRWGDYLLTDFVSSAELETYGITNRYRHAGVGAPLVAAVTPAPDREQRESVRITKRARVASTLLMRLDFARELELADGSVLPPEVDPTAALALRLDRFDAAAAARRAFFSGDLGFLREERITDQLGMLYPYRPGRVPVVFVHGTNSTPITFFEMLNELENDPILGDQLQYWFFGYASGSPIGYSGGLLADALRRIVEELDPEGEDPALRRIVVIGHSQGGLLTKLTVVDSGLAFWDAVFDKPVDRLAVAEETQRILERSLLFTPVESVSRVIFISTPHGGSFLTRNPLSGLVVRMISIPEQVTDAIVEVLSDDPDALALEQAERLSTSLDNMRPGNRFLEILRSLPVVDDVAVHSIVAVQGEGPPQKLSDGVVQYLSAHIQQGSERLVRSGHSAQRHPAAIAEVRRILREHLGAFEDAAGP